MRVDKPVDYESMNFTSKQQAWPAHGLRRVGDEIWHLGDDSGGGKVGDHTIGLQFGAQWTEGSGFTENVIVVDGRLSKIGRELELTYNWDAPMEPWTVRDPGGQLELTIHPLFDTYTSTNISDDLGSEVHQVSGACRER